VTLLCRVAQKQTTADLAQMHKIVQREYQHLLVESSNLEMQLSDIRYSGIGHVTKERKLLDDYDKRLKTIQVGAATCRVTRRFAFAATPHRLAP